jgi:hypothetical protein
MPTLCCLADMCISEMIMRDQLMSLSSDRPVLPIACTACFGTTHTCRLRFVTFDLAYPTVGQNWAFGSKFPSFLETNVPACRTTGLDSQLVLLLKVTQLVLVHELRSLPSDEHPRSLFVHTDSGSFSMQ